MVSEIGTAGGLTRVSVDRRLPVLDRWQATLFALRGWRRTFAAFALGALAVLALPPIYVVPALLVAFTGFLWLLRGTASWRGAAVSGFMFGLGYFTAGLYWVANALLTRPEEFGWFAPFAVLGLAAILAPFLVVPAVVTRLLARRTGAAEVAIFAGAWTVAEWLRSWVLTGFPWNLIGSVWAFSPVTLQPASVLGVYGLSLLTVLVAAMPAALSRPARAGARQWRALAVAGLLLAAMPLTGSMRLGLAGPMETVPGVQLRLIQPNIAQTIKWRRDLLDQHLLTQAEMGTIAAETPPTHVIWSEVAAPMFIVEDPIRAAVIAKNTPAGGLTLLGTLRRSGTGEDFRLWNSMIAIDHEGRIAGAYDKSHLVPFGEYMPLREVIGLGNITMGLVDFSAGPGITTLSLPGLPPVSPLICYEAIFPGAVAATVDRPAWMLNLTNDGWYGQSTGPYQHLVAAQLRAVEEGLPMVRVANTGISAIIDPYGRIIRYLGLGLRGVVDGPLPVALAEPTIYARYGNIPVLVVAMALIAGGALWSLRK